MVGKINMFLCDGADGHREKMQKLFSNVWFARGHFDSGQTVCAKSQDGCQFPKQLQTPVMNGSMVWAPLTQLHLHRVVYGDKKACEQEIDSGFRRHHVASGLCREFWHQTAPEEELLCCMFLIGHDYDCVVTITSFESPVFHNFWYQFWFSIYKISIF